MKYDQEITDLFKKIISDAIKSKNRKNIFPTIEHALETNSISLENLASIFQEMKEQNVDLRGEGRAIITAQVQKLMDQAATAVSEKNASPVPPDEIKQKATALVKIVDKFIEKKEANWFKRKILYPLINLFSGHQKPNQEIREKVQALQGLMQKLPKEKTLTPPPLAPSNAVARATQAPFKPHRPSTPPPKQPNSLLGFTASHRPKETNQIAKAAVTAVAAMQLRSKAKNPMPEKAYTSVGKGPVMLSQPGQAVVKPEKNNMASRISPPAKYPASIMDDLNKKLAERRTKLH